MSAPVNPNPVVTNVSLAVKAAGVLLGTGTLAVSLWEMCAEGSVAATALALPAGQWIVSTLIGATPSATAPPTVRSLAGATTLSAALVAGNTITALPVAALPYGIASGEEVTVGAPSPFSGVPATQQTFTASGAVAAGATSIPVPATVVSAAFASGVIVQPASIVLAAAGSVNAPAVALRAYRDINGVSGEMFASIDVLAVGAAVVNAYATSWGSRTLSTVQIPGALPSPFGVAQDVSSASNGLVASKAITIGAARVGSALVVAVVMGLAASPSTSVSTVSDNISGTTGWTKALAQNPVGIAASAEIWYKLNATGGETTITVTPVASANMVVRAYELPGVVSATPVRTSASNTGTSAAPSSGATASAKARDLAIGVIGWVGAGAISGQNATITNDAQVASTGTGAISEASSHYSLTLDGASLFSGTLVSTPWVALDVVFIQAMPQIGADVNVAGNSAPYGYVAATPTGIDPWLTLFPIADGIVRCGANFAICCPASAAFDATFQAQIDEVVNKANTLGLKCILQLGSNSPTWASVGGVLGNPPADWTTYDAFLDTAIARWGAKLYAIEGINEPNAYGSPYGPAQAANWNWVVTESWHLHRRVAASGFPAILTGGAVVAYADNAYLTNLYSLTTRQNTGADAVTANASPNVSSATIAFAATDVGRVITGASIPANTFIKSVTDASHAVMSANATGTSPTITLGMAFAGTYDFIDIHPYCIRLDGGSLGAFGQMSDPAIPWDEGSVIYHLVSGCAVIHEAMRTAGEGAKSIWVGEVGWTTAYQGKDVNGTYFGAQCSLDVSEVQQAAFIRTALRQMARLPYVGAVMIWSLYDSSLPPIKQWNPGAFGLLDATQRKKPSWTSFRQTSIDISSGVA